MERLIKPAYIISAYKRPDLLLRLVDRLGDAPIAIHIDRKSDIAHRVQTELEWRPNVTFLPRHACYWGLFGHVKASLEGLKWFLATDADYAFLLTGQCYPLKSPARIEADLDLLQGRSIIAIDRFPRPQWASENGGYKRLDRFYFHIPTKMRPRGIKLWTRRLPLGMHPHGGSGYWCLSRAAADHTMRFATDHPEVVRFFRRTYVPDEIFFNTILANSPLKATLTDSRTHYVDWSEKRPNPKVLGLADLPRIMESGAWFARKFEDMAVLDRIDELVLGVNGQAEDRDVSVA